MQSNLHKRKLDMSETQMLINGQDKKNKINCNLNKSYIINKSIMTTKTFKSRNEKVRNPIYEQLQKYLDKPYLNQVLRALYIKNDRMKTAIQQIREKRGGSLNKLKQLLNALQNRVEPPIVEESESEDEFEVHQVKLFTLDSLKKLLESKKTKYGTNYTEGSKKVYINGFQNLSKILGDHSGQTIDINKLNDAKFVYDKVNSQDIGASSKSKIFGMVGYINNELYLTPEYRKYTDILYKNEKSIEVPLIADVKDTIEKLQADDVKTKNLDEMNTREKRKWLTSKLCISLASRASIFRTIKFRNINRETDNYYEDKKFHVNDSKNKKKYTITLTDEENFLVYHLIELSKLTDSDYVIYSQRGGQGQYDQSSFSRLLTSLNISSGQIRKFVSYDPDFKAAYEKKEKLCERIDHSVRTNTKSYNVKVVNREDLKKKK